MHDVPNPPKRLPYAARAGLIALVIAVAGIAVAGGLYLARPGAASDPTLHRGLSNPLIAVVLCGLAFLCMAASVGLYAIALATNALIRDFSRPFLPSFKTNVYLCQTLIPLPFIVGLAGVVGIPLYPLLLSAGLSSTLALAGPFVAVFALAQLPLMWVQLWAPLEKSLITRRLLALGISPAQLACGRLIGISDPAKSTLKKLSLAEDDLGMLWITPEALVYVGDSQRIEIRREQLQAIEQKTDAANVAALAGTAHVILSHIGPDEAPRRVRLHIEAVWTLGAKARAMDELAAVLRRWADGDRSVTTRAPDQAQPV